MAVHYTDQILHTARGDDPRGIHGQGRHMGCGDDRFGGDHWMSGWPLRLAKDFDDTECVKPGATKVAAVQHLGQGLLVDDVSA